DSTGPRRRKSRTPTATCRQTFSHQTALRSKTASRPATPQQIVLYQARENFVTVFHRMAVKLIFELLVGHAMQIQIAVIEIVNPELLKFQDKLRRQAGAAGKKGDVEPVGSGFLAVLSFQRVHQQGEFVQLIGGSHPGQFKIKK